MKYSPHYSIRKSERGFSDTHSYLARKVGDRSISRYENRQVFNVSREKAAANMASLDELYSCIRSMKNLLSG